ncbi:MFS transporter [Abyssicoccus albus]|uniref:Putative MFS family arabinose efflux permease n=1 Tax=Abyssicoccus albus TaxID=1817405 RepID=A0A3N5BIL9_9BACL|nr:MFS transporter [Abyssicoccus albus]RPF57433.1 putative MFS family arabinose efflux permease [Abyssicoccus albus]
MNSTTNKIWTKDFILICIANFFTFSAFQMTLPTLPLFIQELGGTDEIIGMIVSIFTVSALLIRPFTGQGLEFIGRRKVYLTGVILFALSLSLLSIVHSILFLFIIRIIQGFGWGMTTTSAGTVATDIIPEHRRGEGMGYYGLSVNIALAFGPSLGLLLVDFISFMELFLITAGLVFTAFIIGLFIQYKPIELTETSVRHFQLDFFEKNALPPATLLFFITVTFGGITSYLPLYTKDLGFASYHIQLYFMIYAIALLVTRLYSGRLYDQYGLKPVFVPGTLLIIIAMLLLAWLPSPIVLYIAAALYGTGFGSVQPALQAWAVNSASKTRKGMANATFFSAFDLGVGMGALSFGFIAHMTGYSTIYIVAALSVLTSLCLYLFVIRTRQSNSVSK